MIFVTMDKQGPVQPPPREGACRAGGPARCRPEQRRSGVRWGMYLAGGGFGGGGLPLRDRVPLALAARVLAAPRLRQQFLRGGKGIGRDNGRERHAAGEGAPAQWHR